MGDNVSAEEIELYRNAAAVEKSHGAGKASLEKAKFRAAERLDDMADSVMDALSVALVSEDEGIRLKAALALLDRMVPKVAVDRSGAEEAVEVIPESRKRLMEDIETELKRQRLQ